MQSILDNPHCIQIDTDLQTDHVVDRFSNRFGFDPSQGPRKGRTFLLDLMTEETPVDISPA